MAVGAKPFVKLIRGALTHRERHHKQTRKKYKSKMQTCLTEITLAHSGKASKTQTERNVKEM